MGNACHKTVIKPPPSSINNDKNLQSQSNPNFKNSDANIAPTLYQLNNYLNEKKSIVSNSLANRNINEEKKSIPDPYMIFMNTPQFIQVKEWWELKEIDETVEKFTSYHLNIALRKGEKLSFILETMFFQDNEYIVKIIFKIIEKIIIEENQLSICQLKDVLSILNQIILLTKNELMPVCIEFLKNISNNNIVNIKTNDLLGYLEFVVEFFQIILFFKVGKPFPNNEKWWVIDKNEDFLEIYIIRIREMITNIKESIDNKMLPVLETRKIDPPVKRNSRSSKSYNNINLDQEFQKNEINNMSLEKKEYLWEQSDITEEFNDHLNPFENEVTAMVKKKKKNSYIHIIE